MFDLNSGYNGYSMSNRAVEAYENGEKPKSKWTKSEIMECIEECENIPVPIELIKKLRVNELKNSFLKYSSWHHTSSYCNSTDFYEFNENAVKEITEDKINAIISGRKKKTEPIPEKWECSFLEWSGSRAHSHAKEVTAIGTLKGNWLYLDDGSKKSINAKGFMFIRKVEDKI